MTSNSVVAERPVTTIDDVLAGDLVTTVFQPLVHLRSGDIVGFEALSRGPAGSALESPLALLDAARDAGRLADLDWLFRASATRDAMAADLPESITVFVNAEPETFGAACPARYQPVFDELAARIGGPQGVVELTERALTKDPAGLLAAAARVRQRGLGVALDDVGAVQESLALLPFVRPDVVKLDMRLVQAHTDSDIASIANAVRAYAESSGATVLAEGIETAEQVEIARSLGATYGQGWHFGRPGPLPRRVAPTSHPVVRAVTSAETPAGQAVTPFELVAQRRSTDTFEKRLLLPTSMHLETQALSHGPVVLLSCFQDRKHFTRRTRERYARLAEHAAFVAALGVGMPPQPMPGVRGSSLTAGERLVGEWNVIVVGPHFAGALVARDVGDDGPDALRRFECAITYDRDLVLAAAATLMNWIVPVAS